MNTERKSAWNSLEITKLVVAMLTPLLVAIIGYQISRSFRKADEARAAALIEAQQLQKALEDNRRTSEIRQVAVSNFSKFIYERRVRSELLHSALQRHFANPAEQSKREIIERKRLYDEAYVLWKKRLRRWTPASPAPTISPFATRTHGTCSRNVARCCPTPPARRGVRHLITDYDYSNIGMYWTVIRSSATIRSLPIGT